MQHDVPDAIFASDNALGIPLLDLDMCARYVEVPFRAWGSIGRGVRRMTGTWHFYVDDYRFTTLWKDPSKVVRTNAQTVVEPNFSVHEQIPLAIVQYRTFQKRWMARYWQSQGISVLVDMNVHWRYMEDNLLGVPKGWSAFATRGYNKDLYYLQTQIDVAKSFLVHDPLTFVVYGGGLKVREFCEGAGVIWVPEARDFSRDSRYNPIGIEA